MTKMKPVYESDEEENEVEFQKTVRPDGSYVEIITDHRNNRVEFAEYDAQGNCVERVYGRFEETPEISDEEFDEYLASLDSRYR